MPSVSNTASGVQEASQGFLEALTGEQESSLGAATGGAVNISPVHPFSVSAPMAGMSPLHLFNTLGNPGLQVGHAFSVTPPPRDYSKQVHVFSSRVVYVTE